MMTKLATGVAAAAFAAVTAFAPGAQAADPVKIGDFNSYSRMAAFAVPARYGAELAVEQINAAGGVLGGRPIEFITRDDKGDPGEAVKIAEELFDRENVVMLTGGFLSHVGLAVASYADQKKKLFLASEPLADSMVWESGNPYTFRLRASTYMQSAMLADIAAKSGAKRWATIAPNYAYGKEAVASFKQLLKEANPEVEFVAEQWPGLFKIDATAEVQALNAANVDGIFNVTFGPDLAKFVREGTIRGLFEDKTVVSLLTGEPDYLLPLKDEAPEGWLVTGYPWYDIKDPAHDAFVKAYQERWGEDPRIGSIVGYNTMLAVQAALEKAGSTDTEALRQAMEGLTFDSPMGPITFREIDNQSTMGAWVGKTKLVDGSGIMVDWEYFDGADYLPSDEVVKQRRPAE
ncbi:ABC transporter substrate-binding protein [Marinibaculum pumilum]|uniref:ABC transporter substrate-binding protein n=1 Tax=Marinibaculum pumilum TaxID=1766165 RepID=A0ABV7L5Q0_9PROT